MADCSDHLSGSDKCATPSSSTENQGRGEKAKGRGSKKLGQLESRTTALRRRSGTETVVEDRVADQTRAQVGHGSKQKPAEPARASGLPSSGLQSVSEAPAALEEEVVVAAEVGGRLLRKRAAGHLDTAGEEAVTCKRGGPSAKSVETRGDTLRKRKTASPSKAAPAALGAPPASAAASTAAASLPTALPPVVDSAAGAFVVTANPSAAEGAAAQRLSTVAASGAAAPSATAPKAKRVSVRAVSHWPVAGALQQPSSTVIFSPSAKDKPSETGASNSRVARQTSGRNTGTCASSRQRVTASGVSASQHGTGTMDRLPPPQHPMYGFAADAVPPEVVGALAGSSVGVVPPAAAAAGVVTAGLPLGSASGAAGGANDLDLLPAASSAVAAAEADMSRLQALLEARGLPPQLFGALGPRMQHLLHRSVNTGTAGKVQHLLKGMQAAGDEGQQLSAVMEMCQLLVMGNEDSLAGFPIKQVVPDLMKLLRMEHNFDIMNHACRALTYMMESLPRSTVVVVDAVPAFLEKLQVIECMDVAEQALTALEMLSRKHSKAILQSDGISACLTYLDFFSVVAQRCALAVTANCCTNLLPDEFLRVRDALSLLSAKLLTQDKKSVESCCLCFVRLVDSFAHDEKILKELVAHDMLAHMQQLLMSSSAASTVVISSSTFTAVIRMLAVMCNHCPELAVVLLRQDIADTLLYLLVGSSSDRGAALSPSKASGSGIELVSRSPQELYEIVMLISSVLPTLPATGIFAVDALLKKSMWSPGPGVACSVDEAEVVWQWRDDNGSWQNYSQIDSRVVEAAYQSGEEEVNLSTVGRMYTIDFSVMQQINEDSGTTRPVLRKRLPTSSPDAAGGAGAATCKMPRSNKGVPKLMEKPDARAEVMQEQPMLMTSFIRALFAVLYEVYSSSAGPAVRHACLQALLRMVYYAAPDLLGSVLLGGQPVASHIASMLASQDLKVVVGALQMAEVLMQKLPDVFAICFQRQGVVHQVKQLAASAGSSHHRDTQPAAASSSAGQSSSTAAVVQPSTAAVQVRLSPYQLRAYPLGGSTVCSTPADNQATPMEGCSAATLAAAATAADDTIVPSSAADGAAASPGSTSGSPGSSRALDMTSAESLRRKKPAAKRSSLLPLPSGSTSSGSPPTAAASTHTKSAARAGSSSAVAASVMAAAAGSKSDAVDLSLRCGAARKEWSTARSSAGASGGSPAPGPSKASFLASLNPSRWGRGSSSSASGSAALAGVGSGSGASEKTTAAAVPPPFARLAEANAARVHDLAMQAAAQKEKITTWIRDEARRFLRQYFETGGSGMSYVHSAEGILANMCEVAKELASGNNALDALMKLAQIVQHEDVSPFEITHSNVMSRLLNYLVSADHSISRDTRLRQFLHVFVNSPMSDAMPVRQEDVSNSLQTAVLGALVTRLVACIHQQEQFQVKVHDLGGPGGRNSSALKFLSTHQLKCHLQRHPDCTTLKQWTGGPVKVDPLALVQAIERYLIMRGYSRLRPSDAGGADDGSDDDSEDDVDETMAAVLLSQSTGNHRLEFLIGNNVLPYNMTVYQAVRTHAPMSTNDDDVGDSTDIIDPATGLATAAIWTQTHTIWYRSAPDDVDNGRSSQAMSSNRKSASEGKRSRATPQPAAVPSATSTAVGSSSGAGVAVRSKKSGPLLTPDDPWIKGVYPSPVSPLDCHLVSRPPDDKFALTVDASAETLTLLRVVYALHKYWTSLYEVTSGAMVNVGSSSSGGATMSHVDYVSTKLTAKASRQLQDPLLIMTGNLPPWLPQLAYYCPFLLPFDVRLALFCSTAFDRDRAMMRLMQDPANAADGGGHQESDTGGRVAPPRLDRKKKVVSRNNLLKQAEKLFEDVGSSKAVLEIQYENEVGTGLGPTLEFYSLVSKDLQRTDLELWRCSSTSSSVTIGPTDSDQEVEYVQNAGGLYPLALSKNAKSSLVSKMKSKFKFLGKFLAKSLLDSRIVDLPLSRTFYAWLLGEEKFLGPADLVYVDPQLAKSYWQLHDLLRQKKAIEQDPSHTAVSRQLAIQSLGIEDVGLDFLLPGPGQIELRKGGKDIPVTADNLEEYLALVTRWTLVEGVQRQMEAVREGFESVLPLATLRGLFEASELELLFCGSGAAAAPWDVRELSDCCRPDHGYTPDSPSVRCLYEVLASFSRDEQRQFLQFVTGSPRLPVGGFRSLNPPLTIVKKTFEANENPDEFLPSVMTCVNYLKLPDYSNARIMREKLVKAASMGQLSFHLS